MTAPTPSANQWNLQGLALARLGRMADAADCFRQAVELDPQAVNARHNLGAALIGLGEHEAAIPVLEAVVAAGPDPLASGNLGIALRKAGRPGEALPHFDEALAGRPDHADALDNKGLALLDLKRPAEAVDCFERALALKPDSAAALNNLGNALRQLGRGEEAEAAYARAIAIDPAFADACFNLGSLLASQGRREEAIGWFEQAIALKPEESLSHFNLGVALAGLRRRDEAIACFDRALAIDPEYALARAQRMHLRARKCDWGSLAEDIARLPTLGITGGVVPPFTLLAFEDEPLRHRIRAERFVAGQVRAEPVAIPVPTKRPKRLKIGYFSADCHDHAVMHLAIALFEAHDPARFSIHAFSYGPAVDDSMRRRLVAAFDSFTDVAALSDADIAARARAEGIAIAVDLQGHTERSRLGIFANRAAPLQATFLGHPGTSGAPFFDYLVADPVVIPPDQRDAYSERLIVLPHAYQPNDRRRIADSYWTRARAGLPETSFVFCCFNASFKLGPREFDLWMKLLGEVEGSVLWLYASEPAVTGNLRREAERRGVAPDRLVFAAPVGHAEHLARHRLADLFLDTFCYNAHTTASDALWAGLPLVTRAGDGFAARVAASLLTAAGLPELVTDSDEAYAALALDLARQPKRLAAIRQRLTATIADSHLFDGPGFARASEAGYDAAFARLVQGEAPADIVVGG